MPPIILASSSRYRRQLLEKFSISFSYEPPDIDENPRPGESPENLVQRLAITKAQALSPRHPQHLIIGSDQIAVLNGRILGKPGSHQAATEQLREASGQTLRFHTGLALVNSATQRVQYACPLYEVRFRSLTDSQIDAYLRKERPYDCAGSFKSEGLGIALFEHIRGDDPNTLVGLPLIELTRMLLNEGVDVLSPDTHSTQ